MENKASPNDCSRSNLRGRFAVVTGAGTGIGKAVALALALDGMHLLLVGRRKEQLQLVSQQAGRYVSVLAADLATEAGVMAVASAVPSELHVLVHCAGMHLPEGATATTRSAWAALDAVNLYAPVLLTNACLPALRKAAGDVVFVNSTAGLPGASAASAAAYAAAKQALRMMTNTLRQELNPQGIRVLTIYPGRTDTPMQSAILAQENRSAGEGALIPPDDIASIVLASLRLSKSAQVTDLTVLPTKRL